MPTTIPTARADFRARDTRCAGWLTLPPGPGPHPAIVLVHGLGATHDMMLGQYEQHFAAAGIATMAFDYRNTGASDGEPRQHISARVQRHDVAAALAHLKARPEIDPARVGLWGTSLGCMNVITMAATRDDVRSRWCSARSCTALARREGWACTHRYGSRPQSSRTSCDW